MKCREFIPERDHVSCRCPPFRTVSESHDKHDLNMFANAKEVGVGDPEGFEVGLEGVTDEEGGGATLGLVTSWVWTSARIVVAMARDPSMMADHLHGGWGACIERRA